MTVWSVTEVKARLAGRERTVIAFFADETAPKLVGAQTLESFGLGVDPLGRRLIPVDAYLAAGASTRRPVVNLVDHVVEVHRETVADPSALRS
jgi:hypothetical protein